MVRGPGVALVGVGPTLCPLGLSLVPAGACPNPGPLPETEKKARIDQLYEGYRS